MSFSSQAKDELIRLPMDRQCCLMAELGALTQTSGSLSFLGGGRFSVTYQTENTALARRIFRMLKTGLGLSPTLQVVEHARLGGRRTCVLTVDGEDAPRLLDALGMMRTGADGIQSLRRMVPYFSMSRSCCRRSYLRGAFLGAGSMVNPEKSWLMEWVADENLAQGLEKVLERGNIRAGRYERRGNSVVTLRSAQDISDALAMMGAGNAVMELENIRIKKQMRADANRASNCDEHNSERMLNASEQQVEAIKLISIQRGLYTLPPALQEMARLRLEHPEMSLEELGQSLEKPVGKSGVNHRMRRILQAAEEIREELSQKESQEAR